VIAGQFRSRSLRSLPGPGIRPTADRLREALFNVLCAGNPGALEGSVWADLYAGTGAIGIEALSRGAGKVHFVEAARPAVQLIRENLESLGIKTGFEVIHGNVSRTLRRWETEEAGFDFMILDPPYDKDREYSETLTFLGQSLLLSKSTIVIAEHMKKVDPGEEFGDLKRYRKIVQGDTALSFYSRR
jgi:16S rRNA (guanine966-N2)-methyltransferase